MKYLLYIPILVLAFSCAQETRFEIPAEPENLLSQEKVTQVMLDMQLLEASIRIKLLRKDSLKQRIPGYVNQVLEKHQVSETTFKESLEFYSSQHKKITAIYDSVEVRLTRMKGELDVHEKGDKKLTSPNAQDKP